jgi:hypothetical protein
MSAHVAEAGFIDVSTNVSSARCQDTPMLVGDREGIAAARGILTAAAMSLPIWVGLSIIAYMVF